MSNPTPTDSAETATAPSWLPIAVAAAVAAIGAATIVGSPELGYWTKLGPGPGFFPLWLGVLLAALGTSWLASEVRTRRTHADAVASKATGGAGQESEVPTYSTPTVVAIVTSLCVLAACLEVIGYQLSMLIFLFFHLLVLGRRGLLLSSVIAVAGSFGVYVAFTRLLTVPLPASTIPFLRDLGL